VTDREARFVTDVGVTDVRDTAVKGAKRIKGGDRG